MVPALVQSVKVAGLVLISDTTADSEVRGETSTSAAVDDMPDGVDGTLRSTGILRFNETIDV